MAVAKSMLPAFQGYVLDMPHEIFARLNVLRRIVGLQHAIGCCSSVNELERHRRTSSQSDADHNSSCAIAHVWMDSVEANPSRSVSRGYLEEIRK